MVLPKIVPGLSGDSGSCTLTISTPTTTWVQSCHLAKRPRGDAEEEEGGTVLLKIVPGRFGGFGTCTSTNTTYKFTNNCLPCQLQSL